MIGNKQKGYLGVGTYCSRSSGMSIWNEESILEDYNFVGLLVFPYTVN